MQIRRTGNHPTVKLVLYTAKLMHRCLGKPTTNLEIAWYRMFLYVHSWREDTWLKNFVWSATATAAHQQPDAFTGRFTPPRCAVLVSQGTNTTFEYPDTKLTANTSIMIYLDNCIVDLVLEVRKAHSTERKTTLLVLHRQVVGNGTGAACAGRSQRNQSREFYQVLSDG
jgi:hypothetical protein